MPNTDAVAIIDGVIQRIDGSRLVVGTAAGVRMFLLTDTTRLETEGAGALSDLRPGQLVELLHKPSGAAQSARIYSPGPGAPRPGATPLEGSGGLISTVGTIVAVHTGALALQTGGQTTPIATAPTMSVTRPIGATPTDLQVGQHVVVVGLPAPEGALAATRLRVSSNAQPPSGR